ncbi:MAG: sugar-binding protein [Capnocytophaga sp.]|nr:sugar-binding protein [Capnocytophaga sp.]
MNLSKIILGIVSFIGMQYAHAQIDTVSVHSLFTKGKIKSLSDYSFLLEANPSGDHTIDGRKYSVFPLNEDWDVENDENLYTKTNIGYKFDSKGRNTEITTYYAPERPIERTTFIYSKSGQITKSDSEFIISDGVFKTVKTYFYNEKKQLVKIDEYEESEWLTTTTFKYDELGNRIEVNKVASVSSLEKDIMKYAERNLIFESKIRPEYTKEGHYQYNEKNMMTTSEVKYPKQGLFVKLENEYEGDILRQTRYLNEKNQETICIYRYKNGKLVETTYTATDDPDFYIEKKRIYTVSGESEVIKSKDAIVSEKIYNKKGLLRSYATQEFNYTYKYVYDKNGNWTSIVLYESNNPSKMRTRIIEYY